MPDAAPPISDNHATPTKSRGVVAWIGLAAGPLAALSLYAVLPLVAADMPGAGRAVSAVIALMAVWWMTEALPLPATSLLPLVLFPLTGAMPIADTASAYADKLIFLFMGGFMIALAVERWNLHRRIALLTVLAVGTKPTHLIGGFMIATAGLSMWISNTATTVMMLPIAVSVVSLLTDRMRRAGNVSEKSVASFAVCLMLGVAYSASIGGVGTLIGTPTNALLASVLKENDLEIGFAQWMMFALPLVVVFLAIIWLVLTRVVFPLKIDEIAGGRQLIRDQLRQMGPVSRGEWTVLCVFLATALMWVVRKPLTEWTWLVERLPPVAQLDDTIIAMSAALLLFMIPVEARRGVFALDWPTARRLPWGVLLLFGGGLSLAKAVKQSQLDEWIVHQVSALDWLPTIAFVVMLTAVVIYLTEVTSNTPTAAVFLPFLGGVAVGVGADPLLLLVPAGIAASCAFMLPVATPPNAIVFGSGHVTIAQMAAAGFWLNLVAIVLIPLLMYTLGGWVLGVTF